MTDNQITFLEEIEQLVKEKKYYEVDSRLTDLLLDKYSNAKLFGYKAIALDVLSKEDEMAVYALKSVDLDKSLPLGHYVLGNNYRNKDEFTKAISEYDLTIQLDGKYFNAYHNRGLCYFKLGQYDKAINNLNKVVDENPNSQAYYLRGEILIEEKAYDKAIIDLSMAIELDPGFVNAYFTRAVAWDSKYDYEKAIEDYSECIALSPEYHNAYINRGTSLADNGDYDDAIRDYNKAIELDNASKFGYNNRSYALYKKKLYDKAIEDCDEAIKLDQNYSSPYYGRAVCSRELGNYEEAIVDYEKYIFLKSDPDDYLTKLAQSEIKNLKKNIADKQRAAVEKIVTEIKNILLFDKPCITHYTSLSAAKEMILKGSPFRLSEGAYLNDTSEGRELLDYLSFSSIKKTSHELISIFVEKPFIGSFVNEHKHNDLTLWRMYGKEAQLEARGCALTIDKNQFIADFENKLFSNSDANVIKSNQSRYSFYKVAYISNNEFLIPRTEDEDKRLNDRQTKKLNKQLSLLKEKLSSLDENQKIDISQMLNEITYLFKSAEYQYEHEIRLVVEGIGITKKIDLEKDPARVFIEIVNIIPLITSITLGPKIEQAEEWAAAFHYFLKDKGNRDNVKIMISHLPFK